MDNPKFITLFNQDGGEEHFILYDVVEFEDEEYAVLIPRDEEPDGSVIILRIEGTCGEDECYTGIDDKELLQNVFDAFIAKNTHEEFDFMD